MAISLPKILDIPDKLLPVIDQFDNYRYFLLEGGRGGGKSQSIGRFILYLCSKYNLRVVCGREIQNSITESVYSLLADLIRSYNLAGFDIQASKISHVTGSTINFRGFREQGAFNIQGMEGIDILWIDESQALTKQTLDVLIPTIRKENAKVFFSMNRHLVNDPAYASFVNRTDCLHIHINYYDNPFCTTALKREAEECKKISEKDFNHIWLGEPLEMAEDAVYSRIELSHSRTNHHIMAESYGLRIGGFDIARYGDDKCAVVIIQQMGALHWEVYHIDEWDHKDLNYTTGRILVTHNEQEVSLSAIDEDGLGAGPFDTLTKGRGIESFVGFRNPNVGYQDDNEYGNPRTRNAYKVKDMLMKGHLCIPNNGALYDKLVEELLSIKYTFDHSQRRILVSKDKMRKDGIKSPNLADSLIMAVSQIGKIKYDQDRKYSPKASQYAKEDNIFQTAGIM